MLFRKKNIDFRLILAGSLAGLMLLQVSVFGQKTSLYQSGSELSDTLSLKAIAARVGSFLSQQLNETIPVKRVDDTVVVRMLFAGDYSLNNQNEAFREFYAREKAKYTGDPGLKLTGNFTENFEPGILDNEDLTYLRRAYLGVEWDLLSGGLLSNIKKARIMDKELEIKNIESTLENKNSNYLYVYNYLTYLFKRQKIEKLNQRYNVIREQLRIAHQLYFLRYIQWEDILDLQSKLLEVEVMKNNNDVYYNRRLKSSFPEMLLDDSFLYNYLPVLDIDANKMIEIFNRASTGNQLTALKLEKIDLEYNRFSDWSLRPFVRFNYLELDNNDDRTYTSAGLSVSVPLKLKAHQGKVREARQQIMENYQETDRFGASSELLNNYYEYQFKKMNFVSLYFKLLLVDERLRKELVKRDLGLESFSPLKAIALLDERISVEVEMVDVKKDLYLKFLKIFSSLEETNPNNFARVLKPEEFSRRYYGDRSLYVWSDDFREMSMNTLLAYLQNCEIREVMLSPGSDPNDMDDQKIADFVGQAKAVNITTHLMIGSKRIDTASSSAFLERKMAAAKKYGIKSLHLDVEFHTFEDFKSDTARYQEEFITLLNKARLLCDAEGFRLSVSVPVNYSAEMLERIYTLSDDVYVMAYEHVNVEYILRKTKEEFAAGRSKTIIALSAADFSDRLSFEAFARKLLEQAGSTRLAIHDLGRLVDLDNRSLNQEATKKSTTTD